MVAWRGFDALESWNQGETQGEGRTALCQLSGLSRHGLRARGEHSMNGARDYAGPAGGDGRFELSTAFIPPLIESSRKLSLLHGAKTGSDAEPCFDMCQALLPCAHSRNVTFRPREAKPSCFENRWEYSSENTRFQIDRPKQLDA